MLYPILARNRGLVQYFSPYLSADLPKMAESFNTNLANLENELMKLILDGSIQVISFVISWLIYRKHIEIISNW